MQSGMIAATIAARLASSADENRPAIVKPPKLARQIGPSATSHSIADCIHIP
jgi:hypothetical protein